MPELKRSRLFSGDICSCDDWYQRPPLTPCQGISSLPCQGFCPFLNWSQGHLGIPCPVRVPACINAPDISLTGASDLTAQLIS